MLKDIRTEDYYLSWAPTIQEAEEKLGSQVWVVLLVDYELGANNGLAFIRATDVPRRTG